MSAPHDPFALALFGVWLLSGVLAVAVLAVFYRRERRNERPPAPFEPGDWLEELPSWAWPDRP